PGNAPARTRISSCSFRSRRAEGHRSLTLTSPALLPNRPDDLRRERPLEKPLDRLVDAPAPVRIFLLGAGHVDGIALAGEILGLGEHEGRRRGGEIAVDRPRKLGREA